MVQTILVLPVKATNTSSITRPLLNFYYEIVNVDDNNTYRVLLGLNTKEGIEILDYLPPGDYVVSKFYNRLARATGDSKIFSRNDEFKLVSGKITIFQNSLNVSMVTGEGGSNSQLTNYGITPVPLVQKEEILATLKKLENFDKWEIAGSKDIIDQSNFEVINFGLYKAQTNNMEELDSSPTGQMSISRDWTHLKTITEIPAVLDTRFGVEYIINSNDTDRVKLKFIWIPSTPITGETGKLHKEITYEKIKKTNSLQYAGYILSIESELVPDYWTLRIFSEGKLLHEKTFNVN